MLENEDSQLTVSGSLLVFHTYAFSSHLNVSQMNSKLNVLPLSIVLIR
jgi:hypothetical protein